MHGDGVVARLLLLLLHRGDEVQHAFALRGDAHLGPAVEVELAHDAGLVLLAGQGLRGRGGSVLPPRVPVPQTRPRAARPFKARGEQSRA